MATISISIDVQDESLRELLRAVVAATVDVSADDLALTASPSALDSLLKSDLNGKEVAVLHALARTAPDPVSQDELLQICGGAAQKYGNVMSGLSRRWRRRAGDKTPAPWSDVDRLGYRVSEEVALRIRELVDDTPTTAGGSGVAAGNGEQDSAPFNDWDQYERRYRARPETFAAYVDVWKSDPAVRREFASWASFSQAANSEPAQRPERVQLAEGFMHRGGYDIGTPTTHGGRRWQPIPE